MRIALVSDTYTPQVNGVTTILRRIVEVLGAAGHHAVVVAPKYPGQPPGPRDGELRVPSLAFPPYPAIRLSLPVPRRVSRFLDAASPDLVHVLTEGPLGLMGRRYALDRRLPLITSFHTNFPAYCRHYRVSLLEPAVWRWLTWFHRPAAAVHTPGETIRHQLVEKGLCQAALWGRGVDTRLFHPARRDPAWRRRLGVSDRQALVLHVGRLAPEKNLDVLAAALTMARESLGARARFVIAGEGPESRALGRRMPWATQLGFLDPADLARLYASSEVCVLPSHTETCGLVALEAMASGLIVVAADAGGFAETIVHEQTGLLVPAHQPRAFAAGIHGLVLDTVGRRAMAVFAREAAERRDRSLEDSELLDWYAELTQSPRGGAAWRAA